MVRSARAYIASFGTAGSLVACAAVMFVLASAFVSFRGWPAMSEQPSTGVIVAAAQHALPPVAQGRLSPARVAGTVRPARSISRGARTAAARHQPASASTRLPGSSLPVRRGRPRSGSPSGASPAAKACRTSCGRGPVSPFQLPAASTGLAGVVQSAAGAAGSTVTSAGNTVSSAIHKLPGALAAPATGAIHTISQAGQSAGSAVRGAAGAAGGAISGAGRALGGAVTTLSGAAGRAAGQPQLP